MASSGAEWRAEGGDDPAEGLAVLLVDDQPESLLTLQSALEGTGERLVSARSGSEALERLEEGDFGVILLAVQMAGLDGLETAALIQERLGSRGAPLIFLSTPDRADIDAPRCYALGAADCLCKPVAPELLRARVALFSRIARTNRQMQRLNEQLRRRTAEMETANEELKSFSYSVAHDLRAPLRAIIGFAQIVQRRYGNELNEEVRHYLNNILEAGDTMNALIEDLLTYSRLGQRTVRHQSVPLDALFERIARNVGERLSEVGGEISIVPGLPAVRGDPTLVSQLFTNLVENALLYRRPGISPRIDVGYELDPNNVTVRIRDNGIGIAPEHHEKIFHLFQRLNHGNEYPGTGVGLAIVRAAAGLMGGQVWVDSALEKGSTFFARLPRPE